MTHDPKMVERVARATIGVLDPFGEPSVEEMVPWLEAAEAALDASHHAELVSALENVVLVTRYVENPYAKDACKIARSALAKIGGDA